MMTNNDARFAAQDTRSQDVAAKAADPLEGGGRPTASSLGVETDLVPTLRGRLRALWNTLVGGIGLVVGLVPHVLHHIGLLAGTALIAGSGGTVLFGVLGFLASIPFLLRLRRRFNSWRAPAIGLLIFAAMFSLSTWVIGPAINGAGDAKPPTVPGLDHSSHH